MHILYFYAGNNLPCTQKFFSDNIFYILIDAILSLFVAQTVIRYVVEDDQMLWTVGLKELHSSYLKIEKQNAKMYSHLSHMSIHVQN